VKARETRIVSRTRATVDRLPFGALDRPRAIERDA